MGEKISEKIDEKVVGLILHKDFKNEQGKYQTANFFATGTLIRPRVVLTAAHCLKDTVSVSITQDEVIPVHHHAQLKNTKKIISHPNYENTNHRLDFGLIILREPMKETGMEFQYPKLEPFSIELARNFIRYGYGGRNEENRRFRTEMKFSLENKAGFVLSEDPTGVYGDSGGPVFVKKDRAFHLIGIHTGREKDPETRELKDRSFMTPLTPAIIVWINQVINENGLK
jgi:V8-like Glu-specific endopeptidase